jgi:hypothetical protein
MSRPALEAAYAYLLGLYLGDGCLAAYPRTVALLLSLDAAYPGVIAEARLAVERTVPGIRVGVMPRSGSQCVVVKSYWTGWPGVFPQHGPGRKHERFIQLATWQSAVVERYPKELIRGLIHSDGCRTINRFGTRLPSGRIGRYEYPRYFFSNLSEDILTIFTDACDRLGIRWTRPNHRNISVARRDSVVLLDDFVGPKT